jgi:hypothetical protein
MSSSGFHLGRSTTTIPDLHEEQGLQANEQAETSQVVQTAETEKAVYEPDSSQASEPHREATLQQFQDFAERNLPLMVWGEVRTSELPPDANQEGSRRLDYRPRRGEQGLRQAPEYDHHENDPTIDPTDTPALRSGPPTNLVRRLLNRNTQGSSGSEATQSGTASQDLLERNHSLRQAIKNGDERALRKSLDEEPPPNPAAPSGIHHRNAFHKLGKSTHKFAPDVIDIVFDKTPLGHRGHAATAQDNKGNTPLHYVEKKLGYATASGDGPEAARLRYFRNRLKQAAEASGRSADGVRNNDGHTPAQMHEEGRRTHAADQSLSDQANILPFVPVVFT